MDEVNDDVDAYAAADGLGVDEIELVARARPKGERAVADELK
ncbi:hypothetical protein [Nonomuraea jabiensis]